MKRKLAKTVIITVTAFTLALGSLGLGSFHAQAAEDNVDAFVTRMYEVCLNREPDKAGLNDWSSQLKNGTAQGADIAFGFVFSQEFQSMNLCNEHFVDSMYRAFFGRTPDEGGKANWMNLLASGGTRGAVLTGFTNSTEFEQLCKKYQIARGVGNWETNDIPVNGTCAICSGNAIQGTRDVAAIRDFVSRLYTNCLGRNAETQGLENWTNFLVNGGEGSQVASGFVFSEEYKMKDASDTQFVLMLYRTMLGREADTYGATNWVQQLHNGISRETVFNGFLGSEEFGNMCRAAGINVGSAIADNGTTGRASTGEKVQCYVAVYENGTYSGTLKRSGMEGTLVDPTKAISGNVSVSGEPFIAYEGATGRVDVSW